MVLNFLIGSYDEITDEEDKVIILKIFKIAVRPYKPEENKWWINITLGRKFSHREVFDMVTPRLIDGYKLKSLRELQEILSGREDLNLRPPAPKAGALPGCATPR
jgi:hypothetical protein